MPSAISQPLTINYHNNIGFDSHQVSPPATNGQPPLKVRYGKIIQQL